MGCRRFVNGWVGLLDSSEGYYFRFIRDLHGSMNGDRIEVASKEGRGHAGCRAVPWAEVYSRFTLLFERPAIDVLKEAKVLGATRSPTAIAG